MAERLRRYKLSPHLYPRFQYAVTEVERAHRKFDKLTKQCGITDNQRLPPFGYVYVNILETEGHPLIEEEHLTPNKIDENLDFDTVSHAKAKDMFDEAPNNRKYPTVYVTRFSGDNYLPDYFGNLTILINNDHNHVGSTFSKYDDIYICVSNHANFAKDISNMLERYVFAHIRYKTELLDRITSAEMHTDYTHDLGRALENTQIKQLPSGPVASFGKLTLHRVVSTPEALQKLVEASLDSGVDIKMHVETAVKMKPKLMQAVAEIRTMFKRSRVPQDEHPKLRDRQQHFDEEVANELFKEVPEVLGVGYRLDTLIVNLNSSIQDDKASINNIQSKIVKFLQSRNKQILDITFRFCKSEMREYAHGDQTVGDCITTGSKRGTLGGFAWKGTSEDEKCCLISAKHVLDDEEEKNVLRVSTNGDKIIAQTLRRRDDLEYLLPVDIAAARLMAESITVPSLLDSTGAEKPCRVYDYQNPEQLESLNGLIVHLWAVNSKPGKGKITTPKYFRRLGAKIQNIIGIENPDSDDEERDGASVGTRLATYGDSGSLVCADTPDGDFIHAIGMLMGEESADENTKMYVSCDLQSGIEHMADKYQDTFRLCNSIL
ncbi:uncharacterized protein LOC127857362 [Dreissena polymorpha]|uniref:Uncharacterized protein n=1 Tax=Dreissena polymorpha TaxID=45954 RepID=A0A9D3Z600_DREPO|nr:uncharacterized protein LOC127857362 [Dreissena polymorpha]KAH3711386.1 hypothetical protein DPMN_071055 [Dreissena polymorpha]